MAKTRLYLLLCTLLYAIAPQALKSQGHTDTLPVKKIEHLARSVAEQSQRQYGLYLQQTSKQLKALERHEKKLLKKLPADKQAEAGQWMGELKAKQEELLHWQQHPEDLLKKMPGGPYITRMDSLQTLFGFAMPGVGSSALLEKAGEQLDLLKAQVSLNTGLEGWLEERRGLWLNSFRGDATVSGLMPSEFVKWQKEVHSLKTRAQQYKETISDPQKMETEALRLLNRLPAFKEFMSKNGELARLFGPPSGGNVSGAAGATPIAGLQTRESLAAQLASRFGDDFLASGGGLQQQLQQGMEQLSAQAQPPLGQLPGWDGLMEKGESYLDKLNTELTPQQKEMAELKAMALKKRLEASWNLQSATRLQNFPAVRDVGLSLGYKLHPHITTGLGIAYKFALGTSWKDIEWTHEGFGLRSFVEWRLTSATGKLFKNIWLLGCFEMNYWERIGNTVQWKDMAWQKSGLVGVSKQLKWAK
ncbi:MAG TPA: hypothetical protein VK907_04805, partial [Phnomibacter sp.]|nr:hypothetical protein [Phnomibacter sp.]